jgi:hypothetical protein
MKLVPLILISIFTPVLVLAQEAATQKISASFVDEKTAAPGRQADSYQLAYADTTNNSLIEKNALNTGLKFIADLDLYAEIKQTDRPGTDAVADWRERVFKSLTMHVAPRPQDGVNDNRLVSNSELDEQANQRRMVTRIVLKETLKYARGRVPAVDELANILKYEVSNGPVAKNSGAAANGNETVEKSPPPEDNISEDKLYLKTELRIPLEGGKIGLVSESEANYGNVSSFVKIKLDGWYDTIAGMTYVLGRELHVRVERRDTHTTDPLSGDKVQARSSLNLVQVLYTF